TVHPTLPSRLKKLGYRTALIGKWHLGALPKFGPLASGYDHFYGFRGGAVDYFSHKSPDGRDDFWNDDVPVQTNGYMTELLGDRAVQLVNDLAKAKQPFFMSVHFNAPHWPWEAPGDSAESKRLIGKGLHDFDGGNLQTFRRMVEALDTQIGRVMRALRDHGLSNNTIVIFTSDNGGERFSDTWPFSGQKTELLEGGLRVPAVIAWPVARRTPAAHACRGASSQHAAADAAEQRTVIVVHSSERQRGAFDKGAFNDELVLEVVASDVTTGATFNQVAPRLA